MIGRKRRAGEEKRDSRLMGKIARVVYGRRGLQCYCVVMLGVNNSVVSVAKRTFIPMLETVTALPVDYYTGG